MSGDEETLGNVKDHNDFEVLMWGYLPGVTARRSALTSPTSVPFPDAEGVAGDSWKDVCPGGCGFGMAISALGKLITWGSADDQGQSYLTSGKHGEVPDIYPLPTTDKIVNAAAGWAHCASATEKGEVYTWGWKECVPSEKFSCSWGNMTSTEDESLARQNSTITEQAGSPRSHGSKSTNGSIICTNDKISGAEKRRRIATQQEYVSSILGDESLSMPPCLVNLDLGVKITSVAAGGRHTLALSDVGQVWGWGYGGEGQLGLGSRIKMVASPHLIPCIDQTSSTKNISDVNEECTNGGADQQPKYIGSYIKAIACGGRHSVVMTDSGVLLAFGWGLYGQCGQGNTDDLLQPTCVPFLLGTQIEAIAAGLWHTMCVSADGRVHVFGGNQFGQLGLGTNPDQCEVTCFCIICHLGSEPGYCWFFLIEVDQKLLLSTLCCEVTYFKDDKQIIPRLLDAPHLESKKAKMASSGARHNAILTEDGKIFSWGWNKYGQDVCAEARLFQACLCRLPDPHTRIHPK